MYRLIYSTSIVLQLFASVAFLIDEGRRRASSEFANECLLCILFIVAAASLACGILFLFRNSLISKLLFAASLSVAVFSNGLILLRAYELRGSVEFFSPEMLELAEAYWTWFGYLEILLITATLLAIFAGVRYLVASPRGK